MRAFSGWSPTVDYLGGHTRIDAGDQNSIQTAPRPAWEPSKAPAWLNTDAVSGLMSQDGDGWLNDEGSSDSIPGNTSTTQVLTIGGSQTGVVNVPGDDDWFRVDLVAGQSYVFTSTGNGASPLVDPYLELRSDTGVLLAIDDDAGPSTDSMLRFTATTTGTYFINARAWEPETGATLTGGYRITAAIGPPQNPLDTIDLHYAVPTSSITVYFATAGQSFQGQTALRDWTQAEIDAAFAAMNTFSVFSNLTFSQSGTSSGATFILVLADLPSGVLGQFGTTGSTGYGAFAPDGAGWSPSGLQPGGQGFVTIMHEIGHGLGLAHPHDNSGNSETMEGVLGPFNSYGTYGMNQGVFTTMSYNEGFPGHPFATSGSLSYGAQGTPGPLDIALIQQRYGARTNVNAGDNVYALPDANGAGVQYRAIWDTGGVDTIVYSGARSVTIDLRGATLVNAAGGGGFVSYANGIYGGYTIANGVVIENAQSGSGLDTLNGNAASNSLSSGTGNDTLSGGAGFDVLDGGAGNDTVSHAQDLGGVFVQLAWAWARDGWGNEDQLISIESIFGSAFNDVLISYDGNSTVLGGAGNDWIEDVSSGNDDLAGEAGNDVIFGGAGNDRLLGQLGDDALIGGAGIDVLEGNDGIDWIYAGADGDTVFGGSGNDVLFGGDGGGTGDGDDNLVGGAGEDALIGEDGRDVMSGEDGNDWLYGGIGNDQLAGGQGNDVMAGEDGDDVIFDDHGGNDFLFGGFGNDDLSGGDGDDWIEGSFGVDRIVGQRGADSLFGGQGDTFVYLETQDSPESAADVIGAFFRPSFIDVSAIDANNFGADGNTAFVHVAAFTGFAGQMIISFDGTNSIARFDTNGDMAPDMAIVVLGIQLQASDFIL